MNVASNARKMLGRIPTLDGWRAIAIAMVLVGHGYISIEDGLGISVPFRDILLPGGPLGLLGVQIFFGLSGFLITSKLLDEEARTRSMNLRSFYLRRVFRLMPAALLFIAVLGLMTIAGLLSITPGRFLSSIFFFANYTWAEPNTYLAHFWSLAVEEHFYLVWPSLLIIAMTTRRRMTVAIVLATSIAVWRMIDWKFRLTGGTPAHFLGRTDIAGDGLLWGAVVALAYDDADLGGHLSRFAKIPLIWWALVGAVGLISFAQLGWKTSFAALTLRNIAIPLCIVGTVLAPRGIVGALLQMKPVEWLGKASYSIYLWQQLFLQETEDRLVPHLPLQSFPLNFAAAILAGAISYHFLETPMIAMGRRIMENYFRRGPLEELPVNVS